MREREREREKLRMLKRKGESVVECFESKGKAYDSPMAVYLFIYISSFIIAPRI